MVFSTKKVLAAFLILLAFTALVYGGNKPGKNQVTADYSSLSFAKLNLNNLSTYIYINGFSDMNLSGGSGLAFPRGSQKTVVFQSGFLWGGKVNGEIRVGGSTYQSGLQPGRIISPGIAEDTNIAKSKIFRVRPDYKTADLTIEATEEGKTQNEIRARYEKDWMEWPAVEGAPYFDQDGDGKYDPYKDIPGVKDAVQTIWFVSNDLDSTKTLGLYGSRPLGVELQTTVWAYNKDWILNNTYFKKYRVINKSNTEIKDMYLSLWTDPDIGFPADEFAGCDTLLNLGYDYNARYFEPMYGNYPPAVGFNLLQGAVVPSAGDSAIFNGRRVYGKKNLPMTAFYYFINGDSIYIDPLLGNRYDKGALSFYRLFQGKMSNSESYFPVPAELGGGVTKFPLSGDPVAGTGYLDGKYFPENDRRFGLSCGPFNMAPGDTQEVVFAEIAAQSSNNITSVKLLKLFSSEVQKRYNNFFKFQEVPAPEAPKISGMYSKNSITINISENSQIENYDKDGFKFQGYNLYQLPSGVPEKRGAVYLGTFDKVDGIKSITGRGIDTLTGNPVNLIQQKGADSGILREFYFSRDSLGHSPLLIGRKYYFGISAYTYRNDPVNNFTNTESPLGVLSVTFQDSLPGLKYNDALKITKVSGRAEGTITPIVIDPAKLTGDNYQIGFNNVNGYPELYLKDLTRGYIVANNQWELYGGYLNPVYDGIYIKVDDVKPGMKDWQIPQGTRKWSWSGGSLGQEGFYGAIGYGDSWLGTSSSVEKLHNVLIKFASTDSSGNLLNPADPNTSFAYRYMRSSTQTPAKPEFAQYIINKGSGYAYQDFKKNFPFAAYDMESNPPRRLSVGYLENNSAGGLVDGKYWPPQKGLDNVGATGPREWFFIFDVPYSENVDAALTGNPLAGNLPVLWMGTPTVIGKFDSNDQFLILRNHPFTSEDVFTFQMERQTSVANSGNVPLTYEMSQNYPNPFNPVTTISYSLPERTQVELKIYDILGREVMTLVNKEQNAGKYSVQFDGQRLSSGIYIYRIYAKNFTRTNKMVLLK